MTKMMMILSLFIIVGMLSFQQTQCLRMLELQAPASVMRGDNVTINCTFDLQKETLYSIKWYKNGVEFYRYIPSENPPEQTYDMRGIYFDKRFPRGKSIRLLHTDIFSEGIYKCEVSGEAPTFQTVMGEKEMRIYVLPQKGPKILGSSSKYQIGDDVNVTCMSGPSKPPSFLQWDVNNKEVPVQFITRMSPLSHADGLYSSMLGLKFLVEPAHFWQGTMRLRCTAFISQAYLITQSEVIATNKRKITEQHAVTTRDGPTITGARARYQERNVVNINCTAIKAHPPAELRWFINEKEPPSDYVRMYEPIRYPDGLCASVLGLRFTVNARHFQKGEIRLKCTATLLKVTDTSSEEMIITSRHHKSSSGLHVYISRGNGDNSGRGLQSTWEVPVTIITMAIAALFSL